ncbi:MAG: BatB protein [Porticoccaceae bacterium]|nr:BatB protein [Porticoccaceae bacterium]
MLNLVWPWMAMILPLPLLYRLLRKPASTSAASLQSAFYARLTGAFAADARPQSRRLQLVLISLAWIALVAALTRPTWVGEPVALPASGRDLLLAVDISESMATEDMQVNRSLYPRLSVVQKVVGDFVANRRGDRLGLILFGSQAYLQAPLTFDRKTVSTLLREARIGFAGRATAIGDAIAIAIKRLADRPADSKVLILLSDGADTASEIPPVKAAELAAQEGIRIYTIGVGSGEMTSRGLFGQHVFNPAADLDEKTLTAIADLTGGRYFRARDPAQLAEIYQTLDALEPIEQEGQTLRPTRALYHWPLSIALGLTFMALIAHLFGSGTTRSAE